MTKVIMNEKRKTTSYGELNCGDCFFDESGNFCIKVDDEICLVAEDDLSTWETYTTCDCCEMVFRIDTEIHIVS